MSIPSAGQGFVSKQKAYSYLNLCNYSPVLHKAHTVEWDNVSCKWVIVFHPSRFLKMKTN